MKVLVDTSVWSLALRRRAPTHPAVDHLRAFQDEPLTSADYERAAEHFNTCRGKGLQGSNTDFLLCAVAERHDFQILTTDEGLHTLLAGAPRQAPSAASLTLM